MIRNNPSHHLDQIGIEIIEGFSKDLNQLHHLYW